MSEALLEVKDLTKHFHIPGGIGRAGGTVRAIDGVSFSIRRGETVGLVGESGCGKTTTGRCVLLLERPTSGTISFEGVDLAGLSAGELRSVTGRTKEEPSFSGRRWALKDGTRVRRVSLRSV